MSEPNKELKELRTELVDRMYPGLFTTERGMYINRKTGTAEAECQCKCQSAYHKCKHGILCPLSVRMVNKKIICTYCYDRYAQK